MTDNDNGLRQSATTWPLVSQRVSIKCTLSSDACHRELGVDAFIRRFLLHVLPRVP